MPGYSGTPLPKKLGLKPGLSVSISSMPADVKRELKAALAGCTVVLGAEQPADFMMWFVKTRNELDEFGHLSKSLAPAGMLWVSWPKKSSGVVTDLNENIVRETGLAAGLVDVKVCAVTEVWSGLKFVRRLKDR